MTADPKSPNRLLAALASAGWTDLAMSGVLLAMLNASRDSTAYSEWVHPYIADLTMTETVALVFIHPVSLMIGMRGTVPPEDRRIHAVLSRILAGLLAFILLAPAIWYGKLFWAASLLTLGAHRIWAYRRITVRRGWTAAVRLGLGFIVLVGILLGAHWTGIRRGVEWPATLVLLAAAAAYFLVQGLYEPIRILLVGVGNEQTK